MSSHILQPREQIWKKILFHIQSTNVCVSEFRISGFFDCPDPNILCPTLFMHMISIFTKAWLTILKNQGDENYSRLCDWNDCILI